MAIEIINIHSENPENRKINKIAYEISQGAVVLFPGDTGFSLCCDLGNKTAINKIRKLRNLPKDRQMTFLCSSLNKISEFAKVSNEAYKTIKALIPGPYTFILPASKEVPNYAQDPKRKTAGIRVPNSVLMTSLIEALEHPMIAISAKDSVEMVDMTNDELIQHYLKLVDYIVETDNYTFTGESTVIDMSGEVFEIIREGAGIDLIKSFIK